MADTTYRTNKLWRFTISVISTYAGNPYFISLEDLIDQGLLTEEECKKVNFGNRADTVDYEKLYNGRFKLLKKRTKKSNIGEKKRSSKSLKMRTAIG